MSLSPDFQTQFANLPVLLKSSPDAWQAAVNRRLAWVRTARGKQFRPNGAWSTAMFMAGRGFGKTRIGAEETWWQAALNPDWRLAVVAPTQSDLRKVVFEGESGLLARIPKECLLGGTEEAAYNKSLAQLRLWNGSLITGYSAEQPGRLRGPQHHFAWCDELAAWAPAKMQETWDMMQFGLRLGDDPRVLVTTTPQPYELVYNLTKDPTTRLIRGSTYENAANLAATFLKKMQSYEGTELGRQELHAELVDLDSRAILKKGWWRPWDQHTPDGTGSYPGRPALAFASIDGAYTEDEQNDATACTVWFVYVDPLGNTRILCRYAWKERLEFPDLIERLKATVDNFKLGRILIEAKGPGLSLIQEIRRQRPEVVTHAWNPGRADKIARAHRVAPMLKDGMVFAASKIGEDGAPAIIPAVQEAVDECSRFPFASHDDLTDSVTQALNFVREMGFELFEQDRPAAPPPGYNPVRGDALY
jgi:predicted phage terminase large subunit-like protein